MKLPTQQKLSREDLKDAPEWVEIIISAFNTLIEAFYLVMNQNIDEANTQSQIREVIVNTPASYPVMDNIVFKSTLKVRATGLTILQCMETATTTPVETPAPAWAEAGGIITVYGLSGLAASKPYKIRFRIT